MVDPDADWPDAAPGPEEEAAARESRSLVANALDRLPDEQRVVFVMHDIDGFSMPEIAEALESPLNTCYSRLRLARRKFAAIVRRERLRGGVG